MSAARDAERGGTLGEREREALRTLVGRPPRRLLERATDEIEREVLFEDLVILMVEAGAAAMRGLLDLAAEIPAIAADDAPKRGEP